MTIPWRFVMPIFGFSSAGMCLGMAVQIKATDGPNELIGALAAAFVLGHLAAGYNFARQLSPAHDWTDWGMVLNLEGPFTLQRRRCRTCGKTQERIR